ncbi:MAG: FHA domain-containing protein, partial [Holophagales bacterium]|nr:FHA domain-containing protein [Holophagales bacterium]
MDTKRPRPPASGRSETPTWPEKRSLALVGEVGGNRRRYEIRAGSNLVGSKPRAAVFLPIEGVSRRHALLLLEGSRLTLIDLESTNGTFVGGARISCCEVGEGDSIGLGPIELKVEALEGDDATLAFEVGEQLEGPERSEGNPDVITRLVWHPQRKREESWSYLVRHFVGRLLDHPDHAKDPKLLRILEAVNLTGTCVVQHPPGAPLVHLGAWGEVPRHLLDRVREAWDTRTDTELFRSDSEVTFYSTETDGGGLSLV